MICVNVIYVFVYGMLCVGEVNDLWVVVVKCGIFELELFGIVMLYG